MFELVLATAKEESEWGRNACFSLNSTFVPVRNEILSNCPRKLSP